MNEVTNEQVNVPEVGVEVLVRYAQHSDRNIVKIGTLASSRSFHI